MNKLKYDISRPYTAAFVLFRKNGKVAFVLRQNTGWMDGYWGLISGKVEKDESFTDCAIHEAKEEAGITLAPDNLEYIHTQHRYNKDEDTTWVDVFFEAKKWSGELVNTEPHVHKELAWFALDKLPENIIPQVEHALKAIEKGESYSEHGWPKA